MAPWLLFLVLAGAVSAQTRIPAERIAGLPPAQWPTGDGGPPTDALLTPIALAFERNGNLLIADTATNRVRRLTPDGRLSTVIEGARYGIRLVIGLAIDSQGNLYLSDSRVPDASRLVRIAADGRMSGIGNFGATRLPSGIAVDAADNLYITDSDNNVVWKRTPDGTLQIVAGSGKIGTEGEGGPALRASLLGPRRLAVDRAGNLLIADAQRVLRVNRDGTLVRLAGGGLSSLDPQGMAPAPNGSVYIASAQFRIWRWDPDGNLSIIAGTGQPGFSDGCAASGGLRRALYASVSPADVVLDAAGRLYVADAGNSRVRRIDPNGEIRTVAGSGLPPRGPDSILHGPGAVAADAAGNVYFAEPSANRVRQVTVAGQILTVAGLDSPPPGEDPACYPAEGDVLSSPRGLAVDATGNLYISDTGHGRILRRTPDGAITTIAAQLSSPGSIAADAQGNVYVVEYGPRLRRIRADGAVETLDTPPGIGAVAVGFDGLPAVNGYLGLYRATADGAFWPVRTGGEGGQIAVDPAGAVYIGFGSGGLRRVTAACNVATFQGGWSYFAGIASDAEGNLYISDDSSIWRIPPIPPANPDAPSPFLASPGVRNAASNLVATDYASSPNPFHPPTPVPVNDSIAPGEMLRISGGCLGPLEPAASAPETRVLFDGFPAPLLRVQSAEILAVVPEAIAAGGAVSLVVERNGAQARNQLKTEAAVPGVFVTQGTQAAALNEDLTVNAPGNPAAAGSAVALFLTGAGLTDPVSGQLLLPVAVRIGDAPADVLYAGAAPGLIGVAQVNVRIPPDAGGDAVSIQVTVGGISRPQRVTLAIR